MMKSVLSLTLIFLANILLLIPVCSAGQTKNAPREYYQLTVYHYSTPAQEKVIDNYLENALLPALHRMRLKNIGVFKSHANDTALQKEIYVLISSATLETLVNVPSVLKADKTYQSLGTEYINAVYNNPPYTRMESILLLAFKLAPVSQLPKLDGPRRERIYELRSYESATEKIYANKVQMFNEGDEIGLFKRLGFNAVFYGEVLSGGKMPNLMYLTCHANKSARDANWKAFVDDPQWKKLVAMQEYQNNVSHMDIMMLYPTEYSDY